MKNAHSSRPITSPSNLLRRKICPASARMEARIVPSDDEDGGEWAVEGTLLHHLFANADADRSHLSSEQKRVLALAEHLRDHAIGQVTLAQGIDSDADYREGYERRMIFLAGNGSELFPGTCDYWRFYPGKGILLIVDCKFGYLQVQNAADSLQLAAYACMGALQEPATTIYVAIVQPRLPYGERFTIASYHHSQLPAVRTEIERIVETTRNASDQELNPSDDACRWCRAKLACPGYRSTMGLLTDPELRQNTAEIVAQLSPEALGQFADAVKLARSPSFGDVIMKEVARRIEAGQMPGWKLKSGGSMPSVEDVKGAFGKYVSEFAEEDSRAQLADEFLACCDLKITDLVASYRKRRPDLSEKKAKAAVYEMLGDLVSRTPKAASPVREK